MDLARGLLDECPEECTGAVEGDEQWMRAGEMGGANTEGCAAEAGGVCVAAEC